MRKLTILFFTLLLIGIFSTQKADAFVHQYSTTPATQVATSSVSYSIDSQGRYFFYRANNLAATPIASYDISGDLIFQSENLLLNWGPVATDGEGNLHIVRFLTGYPTTYQNMYATKISNTGELEYTDKPILGSMMKHIPDKFFYNQANDSLVINVREGEFASSEVFRKAVLLDNNAVPTTPINNNHVTNPYDRQYCSNRQAQVATVPFDISPAYNGWGQCWDWCSANMDATNALCQFNADGPRNCWINEAPVGGVDNCIWEDWPDTTWPPYSGYFGMPDPFAPTFDVTPYADLSINPGFITLYKDISDGSDMYFYTRMTSGRYVQKFDSTGEPLLGGLGISIDSVIINHDDNISDVEVIDGYIYVGYMRDENADDALDSFYIQKIDQSGTPLFAGDGVLMYQDLDSVIDIWGYMFASEGKIIAVTEEYEAVNWDYAKIYSQILNPDGTKLFPQNGHVIRDYTVDDFQPYSIKRIERTVSGEVLMALSGYNDINFADETRLFVLKADGTVIYEDIGLLIDETNTSNGCVKDSLGNMSCLETDPSAFKLIRRFDQAFQIQPSASFTVIDSIGRNISVNKTHGVGPEFTNRVVDVDLVTPENIIAVELTAQVNVDQNWSTVEIDLDATLGKMFVSGLDGASGVLSNRTVYVPIIADSTPNKARFCPNATSFGAVTADCAGGFTYEVGSANASMVEIEGLDYWKIENLGQDGGFISYFSTAPVDEEETPPPDDDVIPPIVVEETDIETDPPVYPPVADGDSDEGTVVEEPTDETTDPNNDEDDNNGEDPGSENPGQDGHNDTKDDDENESGFWTDFSDGVANSLDSIGNGVEELLESDVAETITVIAAPILYLAISPIPVGVNEWFAFLVRGYNGFLAMMNPKKKLSVFGYVYDSVNKSPLSLAVIRFFNKSGGLVMTSVTNPFGRFNIDLPTDSYKAVVSHTSYRFPSSIVKGDQDAPIANIYHGGFQNFDRNNVNTISVPMDASDKHGLDISLITAKSTLGNVIRGALWIMFGFGFIQSFYLLYTDFSLARIILAVIYVLLTTYYIITNRKVSAGKATYRGESVSNLEVILSKDLESGEILDKRFTDSKGNYNFVAVRGTYFISIKSDLYELSKPLIVSVDSPRPITIGATLDLRRRINV